MDVTPDRLSRRSRLRLQPLQYNRPDPPFLCRRQQPDIGQMEFFRQRRHPHPPYRHPGLLDHLIIGSRIVPRISLRLQIVLHAKNLGLLFRWKRQGGKLHFLDRAVKAEKKRLVGGLARAQSHIGWMHRNPS
jgi:hypothetical protein